MHNASSMVGMGENVLALPVGAYTAPFSTAPAQAEHGFVKRLWFAHLPTPPIVTATRAFAPQ
eukprot:35875-Eustigmatos_ZCMA.PRE.1